MASGAVQSWWRSVVYGAALALVVCSALAPAARAQYAAPVKPIFIAPPMQWDTPMLTTKPALQQGTTDVAVITGGLTFGMQPAEANAMMPNPAPGISWSALPPATEFIGDIRYFWTRLDGAQSLRAGAASCVGRNSYIVFLFQARGLFRISYRLIPDATCQRTADAAAEIFGRFVAIGWNVAQSVHYRVGGTEVVDVTDPTAGYLTTVRWQPRGK